MKAAATPTRRFGQSRRPLALAAALAVHVAMVAAAWLPPTDSARYQGGAAPGLHSGSHPQPLMLRLLPAERLLALDGAEPGMHALLAPQQPLPAVVVPVPVLPASPDVHAGLPSDSPWPPLASAPNRLSRDGRQVRVSYPDATLPGGTLELALELRIDPQGQVLAVRGVGVGTDTVFVAAALDSFMGAVIESPALRPGPRQCVVVRFQEEGSQVDWRVDEGLAGQGCRQRRAPSTARARFAG